MNILYDHQIFTWQKIGGISRYYSELMLNISLKGYDVTSTTKLTNNIYLENNPVYKRTNLSNFLSNLNVRGAARLKTVVNLRSTINGLKKGKFDIFHPTYYDPYYLNINFDKPVVITVYDLIHERFPEMFKGDKTTISNKGKTIKRASRVIAISEQTKKDLIEIYGMDSGKIDVVHLGHSVNNDLADPVNGVPENYILFVGARSGYKNFDRFLEAYKLISLKYPEIHIVCTGLPFTKEESEKISKMNLTDKCHVYFVSDAQLTYLYNNALCFVFPSLYEGFGIPILESFAANCPVALSSESCFPEVARDGAAYFDPYDIESISTCILDIVSDTDKSNILREKGKEVLRNYSWEKVAADTVNVYEKLL